MDRDEMIDIVERVNSIITDIQYTATEEFYDLIVDAITLLQIISIDQISDIIGDENNG